MKFSVVVSQEDIDEGQEYVGVYNQCPVARALHRLGCEKIDADEDRILLTHNNKRYVYKTPRQAMLFIDDFDNGRETEVKPFEFVIEKPKLATIDDERKPLGSYK